MRIKLIALLCVLACGASQARADEKTAAQEAMEKQWTEMITPGAEHAQLAKMAGKWTAEVKSWMDESQPPMVMAGSSEMQPVMGGRYIMQSFHGEMMGQPFEGTGYTGYDKVQKKYVSVWLDNMSTGLMTSIGDASKDGKTSTMSGMCSDPMSGGQIQFEQATTWTDDDHMKFEMFQVAKDGKKSKWMEINYTRQK